MAEFPRSSSTAAMSRRQFLSSTAATGAAAYLGAQTYAAGAAARPGPNDTINMALIGCGHRGVDRVMPDYMMPLPDVRMVAVCDVIDDGRIEKAQEIAGGSRVRKYHDYRELLDDKDIDAVIVATNGHWHALPTIHACQAGKDVYVEKPAATSIGEGRAMVEAAKKYDRIVQIGTQQRSTPHYQKAAEVIQSGMLGEISEVKVWDFDYKFPGFGSPPNEAPPEGLDWDFWVGPSPAQPYNPNKVAQHYWFFDFGNGWAVDWGVHHYDIVHWFMQVDAPQRVTALGGMHAFEQPCNAQWPDTFSGICEYPAGPIAKNGFVLQYSSRVGSRAERVSHGKCFYGSEASLRLYRGGYEVRAEATKGRELGELIESHKGTGPDHGQAFVDAIRSRKQPSASIETGHHSSNPGHLMNIAWKTGRTIEWDAATEHIINDPEADALVTKEYREPWSLKV
ncbi:Gfo/Idh/MocA family protein [Rubinisphaera sp. JC750]|uniref:Gfo/Idh/MocA family protein n=1 Tax=Rubinisphaera sp. JC750 TaxID=2898658 RepID=UPI001F2A482C|nr:Gfo/Idh/MocA family oxidoreductase [Rubinisphaera sp. JC750]